jgi:lipopolysaccharide/colanic/teichoic acid biosynthesis glycosyltransferase
VSETTLTHESAAGRQAARPEPRAASRATAIACRALDIVGALVGLVLLAPVMLIIALWIRLDTRGPALFRQERCGRDMQRFVVNKFRSMRVNALNDEHVAYVQSLIAELPQLLNVLIGNMSLVGPRPCLDYELAKYPPHAFGRFAVKPGITGLWQVSGRSQLSFDEMIALDLDYAREQSFWLNVKILLRTLPVVLLGRGAA